MSSPFDKRAIEKIRHDDAFLPYIAPAPFETHLMPPAQDDSLFDRLVVMSGTPGSGKTTMAQLFRIRTLLTLQRMAEHSSDLAELRQVLAACRAYEGTVPRVAGVRLSMEEKYRDCWECPYDETLRHGLLRTLVNARAMLGWLQGFVDARIPLDQVVVVARKSMPGALDSLGGASAEAILVRARAVEQAAYSVSAALLPPPVQDWPDALRTPFNAVDLIDRFLIKIDGQETEILPLLMLDDIFWLHASQQRHLMRWLAGREITIARWLLTRFDSFGAKQILFSEPISQALGEDSDGGVQRSRDITEIRLQGERSKSRGEFRRLARQVSSRYLEQVPIMRGRAATDLAQMLEEQLIEVTKEQINDAQALLTRVSKRSALPPTWTLDISRQVDSYLGDRAIRGSEAQLVGDAMKAILFSRQAKRTPQTSIFDNHETADDLELEEHIVRPSRAIEHGARIHLWHEAKVPYLYGFEDLADLANENTERFLDFAGQLVRLLQTRLIRSATPRLSPQQQFGALRAHAQQTVSAWNFPESEAVRRLSTGMAQECVKKSLEPNASLGAGASAWGVPMDEFLKITETHPELARSFQFGVAYNVFNLLLSHRTKNRDWCVIELCGPVLLTHGLTLQRGGFLERRLAQLEALRNPLEATP